MAATPSAPSKLKLFMTPDVSCDTPAAAAAAAAAATAATTPDNSAPVQIGHCIDAFLLDAVTAVTSVSSDLRWLVRALVRSYGGPDEDQTPAKSLDEDDSHTTLAARITHANPDGGPMVVRFYKGALVLFEKTHLKLHGAWVCVVPVFAKHGALPTRYDMTFPTLEAYQRYRQFIQVVQAEAAEAAALKQKEEKLQTYEWVQNYGWHRGQAYAERARHTILGAAHDVFAVLDTISDRALNPAILAHLRSVGENNALSVNVLLEGPPGTGKTSSIQAWASQTRDGKLRGLPLYVVRGDSLLSAKGQEMCRLLNPVPTSAGGIAVLMVEDADRFVPYMTGDALSNFLNALEGVHAQRDTLVIRIFSVNDRRAMLNNEAVASRIPLFNRFVFPPHTLALLEAKLLLLLSGPFAHHAEAAKNTLMPLVESLVNEGAACPSMRTFTQFVVRHWHQEDAVHSMASHVHDLVGRSAAPAATLSPARALCVGCNGGEAGLDARVEALRLEGCAGLNVRALANPTTAELSAGLAWLTAAPCTPLAGSPPAPCVLRFEFVGNAHVELDATDATAAAAKGPEVAWTLCLRDGNVTQAAYGACVGARLGAGVTLDRQITPLCNSSFTMADEEDE